MRRVWQGVAILGALLVAALVAVYINPPSSLINSRAENQVRSATGLDLEIKGRSSWSLRPLPSVRLLDVTLPSPPGIKGEPLLRAAAIDVDTTLSFTGGWPSLRPATIRIEAPVVNLAAAGSLPGGAGGTCKPAAAGGPPPAALGNIVISNGTIALADGTSPTTRLEKVFARIAQPTAEAPVEASFESTLRGDRIDGKASLPKLQALLDCAPVRAVLTLVAPRGRAELDAMIGREKGTRIAGKTRLDVPSIEDFANWLGVDPRQTGKGAAAFTGDVTIESVSTPGKLANEAVSPSGGGWQLGVKNGTLAVGDVRAKPDHVLEKIDASATFVSMEAPASAALDVVYNGERFEAQVMIAVPSALLPAAASTTEKPPTKTPATARIATSHGRIELAGDVHPGQEPAFVGHAKGETTNLRALAALASVEVPSEAGFEAARIESDVAASLMRLRQWTLKLWNTRATIDETKLQGALTIDRGEQRPRISGKLEADRIDVRRYVPRSAAAGAGKPTGGGAPGSGDRGEPQDDFAPKHNPFAALESVSIKDTLRTRIEALDRGPVREAVTSVPAAGSGWSDAPLDLSMLRDLDMDLELGVAALALDNRTYSVPSLKTELKDGRLALDARGVGAHNGKVDATMVVDSKPSNPVLTAGLTAAGVEVEQVLSDLGIKPVLAGKAEAKADLTAAGKSLKSWISSLDGTVRTSAVGSSLVGWDLRTEWQSMVARFRKGLGLEPPEAKARTPVDRLSAVIKIDKGVLTTPERIQLRGPQFSASAEGRANLPAQQVDYRGTFATFVAPEIEIPFRASGPLTAAAPSLDWDRVGPLDAIRTFFKIAFSGGSGSRLESVGGGGDDVDPELAELIKQYVDKVEAKGGLSANDAAALRELKQTLGPVRR